MASDYIALKAENVRRYGTDIGRIGPTLLANRYDDRAHFIFELLQNAEDAIKRRKNDGPRSVQFTLSNTCLRFSHYGQLFTEADVRGICGIGESTKVEDLTAIGKFGIGFKAVYAFTDSPEIHSGDEHFAIDSFVWPRAITPIDLKRSETVFSFTFREGDAAAHDEIATGLQKHGVRTLLFLREIQEISWSIENGPSGTYLRETENLSKSLRRVTLIGEDSTSLQVHEQHWLIFSREATRDNGEFAGHVEIAFAIDGDNIQPITDSVLVVYFPTIVPTNLGFLIQGPYRTTPSRDNVPRNDRWNRHLVEETSDLLINSLCELRTMNLLSVSCLSTLPIESGKFGDDSMFGQLFQDVRTALTNEDLLPKFEPGHTAGQKAKLARTQELRELLNPVQLGALFGPPQQLHWLSEEITQDRTPLLRQYLMRELNISELVPDVVLPKLTKDFLEAQDDNWTLSLYEFLNGQPALQRQRRFNEIPLIRVNDGSHVAAFANGQPQAFLPSTIVTGFPTVRRSVCRTSNARAFLVGLGLTEPDPVDDVVWNVLPKYRLDDIDVSDEDYEADIQRILSAFGTDSKSQREKLLNALRQTGFVMSVDAGDGSKWISKPEQVYLATQRLKELFEGVREVMLVHDSYQCLRGENVRELLEACGSTRYLQPVRLNTQFTWQELLDMRRNAGCENSTGGEEVEDHTLRGLEELLNLLPTLDSETAANKARLLWDALADVEDRRGARTFSGTYRWFYYYQRSTEFPAYFVRLINQTAWVPDGNGRLKQPAYVLFADTGWKQHPFLLSKIRFKPPIIQALAKEAGIDLGVLDLLKKLGLTSEADLKARLGIQELTEPVTETEKQSPVIEDPVHAVLGGDAPAPTPGIQDEEFPVATGGGAPQPGAQVRGGGAHGRKLTGDEGRRDGGITAGAGAEHSISGSQKKKGSRLSAGGHEFISYIATHPDEDEPDPDGLSHEERLALEERAIQFVLKGEPRLERTPTNNPGFDLLEFDSDGNPIRWIEVKAMKGTLHDRPVGLSKPQFEHAQRNEDSYWLYVVEQADSDQDIHIRRIQDPVGKTRTFTFDKGWIAVAETSGDD